MKSIQIFEQSAGCCGPNQSASLLSFLERKFRDVAQVTAFDLAHVANAPVPPALVDLLLNAGESALPALVVDQKVVCSGKLPTFLEAVTLINAASNAASSAPDAALAAAPAGEKVAARGDAVS